MTSRIQLELTIKEFAIVKKSLLNYRGKIDFLMNKEDVNLETTQRILRESKVLDYLLDNIKDE